MADSQEIIKYLQSYLNKNTYVSFFIAGSLPQELVPESDLDLFFVIDENNKDVFFNEVSSLMKKYIKNNPNLTYTFFRGPIKYKTKGLIHFLVYTISKNPDPQNKELFINEHKTILRSLAESANLIQGEPIKDLIKNVELDDLFQINKGINRSKEKYEILKREGYINFPEWKNTKKGWKFLRTKKYASTFLKKYLLSYFEKRI